MRPQRRGSSGPSYDLTDSLYGHWMFDTGSGSIAYDSSGNGRNGTLVNMEAGDWITGRVGPYALTMDGVNEYVNFGTNTFNFSNNFTVALWAYNNMVSGTFRNVVGAYGTRWAISYDSGNWVFNCFVDSPLAIRSITYPVTTGWTHLAITKSDSGNGMELYVNGVLVGTFGHFTYVPYASGISTACFDGFSTYAQAQIDDLRIWTRVLPAGELQYLYDLTA